ncbi:hypothetical protein OBBRIDRAFT_797520 [Obba rivulosa]|uniref:Nab2 type CCCH zinc finger 4 domain-containing protein n=1 Tax=Obba rivulosa TaxID=1052685 RepID=A0A8E2ASU1_9APHY|nr:hypothetical protein OBBRIDRAFT_797520 [Obba rivulosa]
MAFGLTINTERADALQNSIQDELTKRGYSPDGDLVMAEYITIMIINNKTPAQITSELEDLIGADFDTSFVDWLFAEAAKGAPESEAPPAPEQIPTSEPPVRQSPPQPAPDVPRRPPNGPRAGAPLYQQAISQAIPSTSPSAQKRTASARSPSPTGHVNKSRRTDLPTGPRAMFRGDSGGSQHGGHGPRSLLERVGPARSGGGGGFRGDDIQARIDNITGQSPDPNMMMMGGFPMNGMGGLDMNAMASVTNPLMLQEMMMNQMALMTQMAGAMGILNPAAGQFMNGGFPMDMGMMNGNMPVMPQGGGAEGGRGRGRGRGAANPRGSGRGRGGQSGTNYAASHVTETSVETSQVSTPTATVAPTIAAPKPTPAAVLTSTTTITAAPQSQSRTGFVPPERPQSPTLCKFGLKCTNPLCRYSHPSPVATPESGVVLSNEACENGKDCKDKDCIKAHVSPAVLNPQAEQLKPTAFVPPPTTTHSPIPCRYGAACTRPGCTFSHPPRPSDHKNQPCRFGAACTRATCPFQHPEGRVLPSTFHRGLLATGGLVSVPTPEAGSMGTSSHHKSMTFNKSSGGSAAELEQKVKEMEEKKSQAEKAVAQAEKAAADKKDDSSKSVAISA